MSSPKKRLFISWCVFQRRTESLAREFDLSARYFFCEWENRSPIRKALSYVVKFVRTARELVSARPTLVFVQLPPTPALYVVAIYCRIFGAKYVADCHNSMLSRKWLSWPFARTLLRSAHGVVAHNEDIASHALGCDLDCITLSDPLPSVNPADEPEVLEQHGLIPGEYVIVPWSFSPDEPIEELFGAARSMPETVFVMTWFTEKLSPRLRKAMPENVVLTGFLSEASFCGVFARAGAALVLTTKAHTQSSAASEAIVLGVPLVVTDSSTTRALYGKIAVFVDNSAAAIEEGLVRAFGQLDQGPDLAAFRRRYVEQLDVQIREVRAVLDLAPSSDPVVSE